jgi:hypothetical protein
MPSNTGRNFTWFVPTLRHSLAGSTAAPAETLKQKPEPSECKGHGIRLRKRQVSLVRIVCDFCTPVRLTMVVSETRS